ncbi:MAG: hypothetical protein J6V44_15385 [Methanobrevibacter sp.]|nr:hypothetical protein [Methanobrevibacter sp.]MBO7694597.1 hypothetical protein [Methanobrevibacter sp.]
MYGYIYMTTNLIDGRKYIGQKKSDKFLHEKYLGSGKILKQAIEAYGKENFKVELLCECESKEELDEMEIYYIKFYYAQTSRKYYNICKGGQAGPGGPRFKDHHHTEETKQKMSESRKGEKNSNYGNRWTQSDELKALHSKISSGEGNGMFGKKHSNNTKKLIGEQNLGRIPITNGTINKRVKPEDLEYYLSLGFYKGYTKKQKED